MLFKYVSEGLDQAEFIQFVDLLKKHQPSLVQLVSRIGCATNTLPTHLKRFLIGLAKQSCISSLIHFHEDMTSIFNKFKDARSTQLSQAELKTLQLYSPLVANVIKESKCLPEGFSPLIQGIFQQVTKLNSAAPHHLKPSNMNNRNAYFPSLKVLCERGRFTMDKKIHKEFSCEKTTQRPKCTKKTKGHPTLSPGIFLLFCSHGKLFRS